MKHSVKLFLALAGLSIGCEKTSDWRYLGPDIPYEIHSLAVDPVNPDIAYAVTGKALFKSTDSGDHWAPIPSYHFTGPEIYDVRNFFSSAIAIDSESTVYLGALGGLYRSVDFGNSWTRLETFRERVVDLGVENTKPDVILALASFHSIYRSQDKGETWTGVMAGRPILHASPKIHQIEVGFMSIYAAAGRALFRTNNMGTTWHEVQDRDRAQVITIHPGDHNIIYTGSANGLLKSTDRGESWNTIEDLTGVDVRSLAIDPQKSATLYAGTAVGIFKSVNQGKSWERANSGLVSTNVHTLQVSAKRSGTVYAGTSSGVFKSTDGGNSWSGANSGLTDAFVRTLLIDPRDSSTLYAGIGDSVFVSRDTGNTWVSIKNISGSADGFGVCAFALDPDNPDTLYAGTGDGFFVSENMGETWRSSNSGLPEPEGTRRPVCQNSDDSSREFERTVSRNDKRNFQEHQRRKAMGIDQSEHR